MSFESVSSGASEGEKDFHGWENPFSAEEWESKHQAFGARVSEAQSLGEVADAFDEYASGNEWVLGIQGAGKEYIDPAPILEALRAGDINSQVLEFVHDSALSEAIRRVEGR
ncbi:MAG: hypothetical protein AAB372_03715 [Patescibacteria group bacterium]